MDLNKFDKYLSEVKDEKEMDKKMLKKGKNYKIILPKGKGEPLYTNSFNGAKEMAKEYGKGVKVINLKDKINEATLKYERDMQKRIMRTSEKAQDAFWKIVKSEMKDAKGDNIDSYQVQDFDRICNQIIKHWVMMNIPKPKVNIGM